MLSNFSFQAVQSVKTTESRCVQKMTSFPCTHVKLPVHAEVISTATSNNDRTKIDKDEFAFD